MVAEWIHSLAYEIAIVCGCHPERGEKRNSIAEDGTHLSHRTWRNESSMGMEVLPLLERFLCVARFCELCWEKDVSNSITLLGTHLSYDNDWTGKRYIPVQRWHGYNENNRPFVNWIWILFHKIQPRPTVNCNPKPLTILVIDYTWEPNNNSQWSWQNIASWVLIFISIN